MKATSHQDRRTLVKSCPGVLEASIGNPGELRRRMRTGSGCLDWGSPDQASSSRDVDRLSVRVMCAIFLSFQLPAPSSFESVLQKKVWDAAAPPG